MTGTLVGPQGFWGSGENSYFFSVSWGGGGGGTGNYFMGYREQAHSFADLGSPAKKSKIILKNLTFKEKYTFCLIKKPSSASSVLPRPHTHPLIKCNYLFTCTSGLVEENNMTNYISYFDLLS